MIESLNKEQPMDSETFQIINFVLLLIALIGAVLGNIAFFRMLRDEREKNK